MTESYVFGADAYQQITDVQRLGQTFMPTSTHHLHYVSLRLRTLTPNRFIQVLIYRANTNDEPYGNAISTSGAIPGYYSIDATTHIYAFPMSDAILYANTRYAIVLTQFGGTSYPLVSAYYDSTAATYPRGIRIYNTNPAQPWIKLPNQDMIFSEWGHPTNTTPTHKWTPVNLATIAIKYQHNGAGVIVTVLTGAPAYMTMYYTTIPPKKWTTTRVVRGEPTMWYTHYALSATTPLPQVETGDSVYHTFYVPNWPVGSMLYFTFKATVHDVSSGSRSAIFFIRRPTEPTKTIIRLRPIANGDWTGAFTVIPTGMPHWQAVSEFPVDGDSSMVRSESIPGMNYEIYKIEAPPTLITPITRVRVHAVFRRVLKDKFGAPYTPIPSAKMALKTNGSTYFYPSDNPYEDFLFVLTTWFEYHTALYWLNNPQTGVPWTWDDIATIQIGVAMRRAAWSGIQIYTMCTQVWLEVEYQPWE